MTTKAITNYEKIRTFMRSDGVMDRFGEILADHQASSYVASALIAVSQNDKLQECTPVSILGSTLQAATLKLSCDPNTGHAYLVPYRGVCTMQIGYKGLNQLALRTGKYRYISIIEIFDGQEVEERFPTGIHDRTGQKLSDEVVGYVAYLELKDGYAKSIYMSVEDIHKIGMCSPAYSNKSMPWQTNTKSMEKKTIFKQLINKWGYLDPHDAMVIEQSEQAYTQDLPDVALEDIEITWTDEQTTPLIESGFAVDYETAVSTLDASPLDFTSTPGHIKTYINTMADMQDAPTEAQQAAVTKALNAQYQNELGF